MKKSLGLGCLLLSLVTTACGEGTSLVEPAGAGSAAFGALPAVPEQTSGEAQLVIEELRGDVMIMPVPGGSDMVVAVDRAEGGAPDGIADQAFRLQRSEGPSYGLRRVESTGDKSAFAPGGLHLRNASLRFNGRSLYIDHPEYSAVLGLKSDVLQPGSPSARWIGFGLSRSSGQWPMTVSGLAQAAKRGFVCGDKSAVENPGSVDDGAVSYDDTPGQCAAGGIGASSCSIQVSPGSCSVSCEADYYACCNVLGGCKCVKDGPE